MSTNGIFDLQIDQCVPNAVQFSDLHMYALSKVAEILLTSANFLTSRNYFCKSIVVYYNFTIESYGCFPFNFCPRLVSLAFARTVYMVPSHLARPPSIPVILQMRLRRNTYFSYCPMTLNISKRHFLSALCWILVLIIVFIIHWLILHLQSAQPPRRKMICDFLPTFQNLYNVLSVSN